MWRTHRRRQGREREESEEAIVGTTVDSEQSVAVEMERTDSR